MAKSQSSGSCDGPYIWFDCDSSWLSFIYILTYIYISTCLVCSSCMGYIINAKWLNNSPNEAEYKVLYKISIIETQMMGSVRTVISGQPGNVGDEMERRLLFPENGKDEESHQGT